MVTKTLALCLLFTFVSKSISSSDPIVKTEFGEIEGFRHPMSNGKEADVFLGVRYAQAPEGALRFAKPQLVAPWNGTVLQAKKFGTSCYGYIPQETDSASSEDCLFINVIAPSEKNASEPLPVMVYIYGGCFELGSTVDLGYEILADNFASKDIIFITMNYRVGPLGFFSTGDKVMPGNVGLWDQQLALQFIRKVLPAFGGDVNRITMSGHGRSCQRYGTYAISSQLWQVFFFMRMNDIVYVSIFVTVDNKKRNLFEQAIQISGSLFAEWSLTDNVITESAIVANTVGCNKTTSEEVLKCLQQVPIADLLKGVQKTGLARERANFVRFQPRLDNDFFPSNITQMLKNAPKKKSIQGLTSLESGLVVFHQYPFAATVSLMEEQQDNYTAHDLNKFITDRVVPVDEFANKTEHEQFLNAMLDFYEKRDVNATDKYFYLQRYIELLSHLVFVMPSYQEIELKRMNGWETYFYVIDQELEKAPKQRVPGALHAGELPLLLKYFGVEKTVNEADKPFKDAFIGAFASFVKTGKPSVSNVTWHPVTDRHHSRNLRLNRNSSISEEFDPMGTEFWLTTLPNKIGAEVVKRRLPAAEAYYTFAEN